MILAYIFIGIAVLVAILGLIFLIGGIAERDGSMIAGGIVTVIISVGVGAGILWWMFGTAGGARAAKDFQSTINNGIERIVTVYDINGDVIKEYSGKFDIKTRQDSILFDDENGKRHIIYYSTGTVIVDEK